MILFFCFKKAVEFQDFLHQIMDILFFHFPYSPVLSLLALAVPKVIDKSDLAG